MPSPDSIRKNSFSLQGAALAFSFAGAPCGDAEVAAATPLDAANCMSFKQDSTLPTGPNPAGGLGVLLLAVAPPAGAAPASSFMHPSLIPILSNPSRLEPLRAKMVSEFSQHNLEFLERCTALDAETCPHYQLFLLNQIFEEHISDSDTLNEKQITIANQGREMLAAKRVEMLQKPGYDLRAVQQLAPLLADAVAELSQAIVSGPLRQLATDAAESVEKSLKHRLSEAGEAVKALLTPYGRRDSQRRASLSTPPSRRSSGTTTAMVVPADSGAPDNSAQAWEAICAANVRRASAQMQSSFGALLTEPGRNSEPACVEGAESLQKI